MEGFALAGLRMMLVMGTGVSLLDLGIAASGDHSAATVGFGAALAAGWLLGAVFPLRVARWLRPRGLVLVPVVILALGIGATGAWNTPYEGVNFALMGVVVMVASRSWTPPAVLAAILGYIAGLLAEGYSPATLATGRYAATVANNIGDLVLVAVILLLGVEACRRLLIQAPVLLDEARFWGAAATPALGLALRRADLPPLAVLPRPPAHEVISGLTGAERRVLERLAAGLRPKQVAFETGVTLATVRTQIAVAKRKTGARTIEQLVAWITEATP